MYEHKVCTRTRRIGSVYCDEMTLLLNLWLTISQPARKNITSLLPVSPPLSSPEVRLHSPARIPTPRRSPTTPHRISLALVPRSSFRYFSLFSIVRSSTHASLDPLFFLTPNIHYLTVIYIFLLFNIFQYPSLLLTKNETRISLSLSSLQTIYVSIYHRTVFTLHISSSLTTISHRFSILLPPVVSWLLRSSPPLCTTLSRPVT